MMWEWSKDGLSTFVFNNIRTVPKISDSPAVFDVFKLRDRTIVAKMMYSHNILIKCNDCYMI